MGSLHPPHFYNQANTFTQNLGPDALIAMNSPIIREIARCTGETTEVQGLADLPAEALINVYHYFCLKTAFINIPYEYVYLL